MNVLVFLLGGGGTAGSAKKQAARAKRCDETALDPLRCIPAPFRRRVKSLVRWRATDHQACDPSTATPAGRTIPTTL